MRVLVWDNEDLGSKEQGNVIREIHAVYPTHVIVKMNDGQLWTYQNAVSINELHCPKCKMQIPENYIGRENDNVSDGYVGACPDCDEDFYLFELLNNSKTQKNYK